MVHKSISYLSIALLLSPFSTRCMNDARGGDRGSTPNATYIDKRGNRTEFSIPISEEGDTERVEFVKNNDARGGDRGSTPNATYIDKRGNRTEFSIPISEEGDTERVEFVKNIVAREIEKELEKGAEKGLLLQAISDASEEGKSEDPLAYFGIQEAIYESRNSEFYKKYHELDKAFREHMGTPRLQESLDRLEEAGTSVASIFENNIKEGVQKEKQGESGEKKPVSPMRRNKGNNENSSSSSSDTYISPLDRDQNDDTASGNLKASPMTAAKALVRIPFLLPAYIVGRIFLRGALATASTIENLSHDNQVIQHATKPEHKPTTSAQPILSDEGIGNVVNSSAREYALLSVKKSNLSDSAIKSVQFTDSQKLAPTIIKSRSNEANSSSRSGIVAFKDEVIDPTWMEESIYPTPPIIPGYDIAFASDVAKALCDRNEVYDHTSYIPAPKGFHKDEEELRLSISEGYNDADSSSEESSLPTTKKYRLH